MPQSYFGKDALEEDYKAALRGFRHSISLNGAYTAVILILLGVLLDYFVYPQHQLAFAISRIVCVASFYSWLSLSKPHGASFIRKN